MEIKYAPIILFVYNRPKHTYNLLISLNNLKETPNTDIIIYSDGFKSYDDNSKNGVLSVRKVLNEFNKISKFQNYKIITSDINKGLAQSIIDGVSECIKQYRKVIVLEDDLIVSNDFLNYMNRALDYYKNNNDIWSISAYTFPMKSLRDYKHDIYLAKRACSWGWATWDDRWDTIDWNVKDYSKFKLNFRKRYLFSMWGKDLPTMLDAYMRGEIKSWAIRWCYSAFLQNKYTVYPVVSRIMNKGTDGSGTNFTTKETRYDTIINSFDKECIFETVNVNEQIRKEFSQRFSSTYDLWKMRMRWTFKNLLGI